MKTRKILWKFSNIRVSISVTEFLSNGATIQKKQINVTKDAASRHTSREFISNVIRLVNVSLMTRFGILVLWVFLLKRIFATLLVSWDLV